jgi:hypothetical protein
MGSTPRRRLVLVVVGLALIGSGFIAGLLVKRTSEPAPGTVIEEVTVTEDSLSVPPKSPPLPDLHTPTPTPTPTSTTVTTGPPPTTGTTGPPPTTGGTTGTTTTGTTGTPPTTGGTTTTTTTG